MRALLLAAAAAALPLAASPAAKQKIAVLDVRAVQGVAPGTATILTAIVVDGAAKAFDVISQADVAAMIGFEKQKQMLGCAEDSGCLAEIGGALGVDYVLSGQVGQIGSRYHLSLQILDSRKAKVVSRAARFSEAGDDALVAAAQAAVADLVAGVSGQARGAPPQLPAGAGEPHARSEGSPRAPPLGDAGAAKRASFWSSRTAAWATMGAGVALAAGGLAFGLQARAARDDLADAWRRPDYASFYDRKSSDARRNALLANVLYGAGAATAGVGVWMYTRSRSPEVRIVPLAANGSIGLVAAGGF
jgi:TolB-like protein